MRIELLFKHVTPGPTTHYFKDSGSLIRHHPSSIAWQGISGCIEHYVDGLEHCIHEASYNWRSTCPFQIWKLQGRWLFLYTKVKVHKLTMNKQDKTTKKEMPQYQSHKKVWALKIKAIELDTDGSAIITPEEPGYAPFRVSQEYNTKHNPQAGGYYVVYEDGYISWSPGPVFEKGYTPVQEDSYLARLIKEKAELDEKSEKLYKFISNNLAFASYSDVEQGLFRKQYHVMGVYSDTLKQQIELASTKTTEAP